MSVGSKRRSQSFSTGPLSLSPVHSRMGFGCELFPTMNRPYQRRVATNTRGRWQPKQSNALKYLGCLFRLCPVVRAPERQPSSVPSRSEEHTSELQSLMRISYAVFGLKN